MANMHDANIIRSLQADGKDFITHGELLGKLQRKRITQTLRLMLRAAVWRWQQSSFAGEWDGWYHDSYQRGAEDR